MTDVFNLLSNQGITPNQYFVLHHMHEGLIPANASSYAPDRRKLNADGWIIGDSKLSAKSIALVKKVNGYFKVSKKKTNKSLMGDKFKDQIKIYNELYPNMKLPHGTPARSSMNQLEERFRWFFDKNDYTWDEIHKATSMYLTERELNSWKMTTCAKYFIKKRISGVDESKLADFCELVRSGGDVPKAPSFTDKVF